VANAATSTEASTNTPTAPENTDALYVSASPANNNDDFVARSLWITGLTRDTKAIDLKKICKEFGKFIRAKVFEKQRSLACFGFVTMGDVAAAEKAIAALDAKQINGAVVSVRKADTLDTATLQMLTSAKTVRNDDPRVVNVTISNVNANSTIKKEDSKNSRPSRSFPLLPPRQHSHRTVSNVSACRRDSPPKVSSTHCRKPERSERSSFVAPPNPSRVSEQTSARAKKRRSNETLYLPSNRMTREEEALKKEREQLERDRRDLEEHRRKVELLITLQQQKLERASSPFASPHCSRHRSRSQHGQHRPQSKVRDRNRRDGLYSSHRYPTPIDRRISRSPPPLGDRYDGEWEAKERSSEALIMRSCDINTAVLRSLKNARGLTSRRACPRSRLSAIVLQFVRNILGMKARITRQKIGQDRLGALLQARLLDRAGLSIDVATITYIRKLLTKVLMDKPVRCEFTLPQVDSRPVLNRDCASLANYRPERYNTTSSSSVL
ncbi:hypothetical protein ANCDUO_14085, partial [Ancylostoma duodenale]